MALVQYGGGVTEFSGAIGGTVFSRNHAGAIAKKRTYPVNNFSYNKNPKQNVFGYLSNAWKELVTSSEKTNWSIYASNTPLTNRLGQTYYMTGLNAFLKFNVLYYDFTGSILTTAPTTGGLFSTPGIVNAYITIDNSANTITFASGAFPDVPYLGHDTWTFIYQCLPTWYGNTSILTKPFLIDSFFVAASGTPAYPIVCTPHWPIPTGLINGLAIKRIANTRKCSAFAFTSKQITA